MSMIVGICFDLFPLTHNLDAYNQTHSTHYLFINIIGQLLIIIGIFSNDLELLMEISTIGIVLLCWGVLTIAWPSWKLHRNSNLENINSFVFLQIIGKQIIMDKYLQIALIKCWLSIDSLENCSPDN